MISDTAVNLFFFPPPLGLVWASLVSVCSTILFSLYFVVSFLI